MQQLPSESIPQSSTPLDDTVTGTSPAAGGDDAPANAPQPISAASVKPESDLSSVPAAEVLQAEPDSVTLAPLAADAPYIYDSLDDQTFHSTFSDFVQVLAKEPAKVEIYNDIDGDLINFFRVVRDSKLCGKLEAAADNTLYSRAEFELAKQVSDDPVESARRFIVRHRMSFGGMGGDWCYSVHNSRKGTAAAIRRWRWGVDALAAIHQHFKSVQIECADWRDVMSRYDRPETLFYLDPPYVPQTRVAGTYSHELTQNDHRELVASLLSIRGMVVLSGYAHATYGPLERAAWVRIDYPTCTHVRGSLTRRMECLWLSPSVARQEQNRNLFSSPRERMSEGAHHAHSVMVAATSKKVLRAIERLRAKGKKPTATRLARATKMSREHLARKYRHLFASEKV